MTIRNNSEFGDFDDLPDFSGSMTSADLDELKFVDPDVYDDSFRVFTEICGRLLELEISPEGRHAFGASFGDNWFGLYAEPYPLKRPGSDEKIPGQRLVVNMAHRDSPNPADHHIEIDDYYINMMENRVLDIQSSRSWNPRLGNWRREALGGPAGPVIVLEGLKARINAGREYSDRIAGQKLSNTDTPTMRRLVGHLSIFRSDMRDQIPY